MAGRMNLSRVIADVKGQSHVTQIDQTKVRRINKEKKKNREIDRAEESAGAQRTRTVAKPSSYILLPLLLTRLS